MKAFIFPAVFAGFTWIANAQWTLKAFNCQSCSQNGQKCVPTEMSGTGSSACTAFNFPAMSFQPHVGDSDCHIWVTESLEKCQLRDGSFFKGNANCFAPNKRSSGYYYAVDCP